MNRLLWSSSLAVVFVFLLSQPGWGRTDPPRIPDPVKVPEASKPTPTPPAVVSFPVFEQKVITPDKLGLPSGSRRSSEPVNRIYQTNEKGDILKEQPKGYPFTPQDPKYVPKSNETYRQHEGVDVGTSSKPTDYKSGVYGVVVEAGRGPKNTVTVQIADGTRIEYMHSSKVHVQKKDIVTPDTVIGTSGDKGAPGQIHIHIQAKDKNGKVMHPDQAFQAGERNPKASSTPPATKGGVGGVLVNPVPQKEGPLTPGQAEKILPKGPDGKPQVKWTIPLPKGSNP